MSELPSVTNCTDIDKMLSEEKLRSVPNLQQFKHLSPFVLNHIMRMDGRLQNSNLPLESKRPVILPTKHRVIDMLIRLYHEREGHSGTSHVLNCMRKSFWILRGRAAVRRVLHACFKCRLWSTGVDAQRMANLPEARVTAGRPSFTATSVDLMGPMNVKQGRNTVNRCVVVFACMTMRAVHLEIAQSLEASAFIQAFRQFTYRRSMPKFIFSDNGTNFKGAERELNDGIKAWNCQQFQSVIACVRKIENLPKCQKNRKFA